MLDTPDFIDSKFRLAILAAKRAKQLVHGARKKVDIDAENPLSVAMEEIRQQKISFQVLSEDALELEREAAARAEREAIAALEAEDALDITDETESQDIEDLLESVDDEDIDEITEEEFEDEPEEDDQEDLEEEFS